MNRPQYIHNTDEEDIAISNWADDQNTRAQEQAMIEEHMQQHMICEILDKLSDHGFENHIYVGKQYTIADLKDDLRKLL